MRISQAIQLSATHKSPTFVSTVVGRMMELMLVMGQDDASSSPPPEERVAEMQEMGSIDAPEDSRQQRGAASPTCSREGTVGSSVDVARPRHKGIDPSGSNQEPELVCDAESVGCMENVSSGVRQTATRPPPEPTFTTSLFGKGPLEPVVDSDIFRTVAEKGNSNRLAELGAQAAEAYLPSDFCKDRTMVLDGTEDESIGVEDWLDVTHAMLDTGGFGLDLK